MVNLTRFLCAAIAVVPAMAEVSPPVVNDPQFQLTLFAAEPDVVTPIGIAADRRGRIFVVESHTHFPKPDYAGPKFDRVKLFEDMDGNGRAERISIFADGLYHAMNLAFAPDGRLYLTHRNGVIVLEDQDGNGVSESQTQVLELETPGNYPHNGIGGIAFSADGWLYIGMGENLGEKYVLKGRDGRTHSGGGEGGNIFRCKPDGSQLELVATGFWNPFAMAFDRQGRLLAVDNDPDSRPPCRLLDVIEGGDYGYKFRYGRSGLHPFTAWNGELPGTLPMVAGTGEAPSGILNCALPGMPKPYRGGLLVTSWGDHELEFFKPQPFGASLRSERQVIVHGDETFRPVAIAAAPNGTIYFTDWVNKDYSVHGFGRIWRLASKPEGQSAVATEEPAAGRVSEARRRMFQLLRTESLLEHDTLIQALADEDPFIRSAAVTALSRPIYRDSVLKDVTNTNPRVRLGVLLALRRSGYETPGAIVARALWDPDEQIRRIALVWAAEEKLTTLASSLSAVLSAGPVSPALLRTYNAAAEILAKSTDRAAPSASEGSTDGPVRILAMAVPRSIDVGKAIEMLSNSAADSSGEIQAEAARTLAESSGDAASDALVKAALKDGSPEQLRAEAILALANRPDTVLVKLIPLLKDPSEAVRIETARSFRQVAANRAIRHAMETRLTSLGQSRKDPLLREQLEFALARAGTNQTSTSQSGQGRPASEDDWRKALAEGGDIPSGRRVFFHPTVGCARCHRIEDHGGNIGPDLSTIALASSREKLIQSILHPSQEIAPQFATHTVEVRGGETYSGLLAGQTSALVTLITADNKSVIIPAARIVSNIPSTVSLMPEGLVDSMSVQDFRDLLAFLLSRR